MKNEQELELAEKCINNHFANESYMKFLMFRNQKIIMEVLSGVNNDKEELKHCIENTDKIIRFIRKTQLKI